jgi:hypothetical protein
MGKRILIIDSGLGGRDFLSLVLGHWTKAGAILTVWSSDKQWLNWSKESAWSLSSLPHASGMTLSLLDRLSWYLVKLKLIKMAWWQGCDAVLLHNWPEKVMLSSLVRRLKMRLLWLEDGAVDYDRLAPDLRVRLIKQSAQAKVLAINEELVGNLTNLGYHLESLRLIPSCGRPEAEGQVAQQNLARHFKLRKDYFTICAKVDWSDSKMAELLIKSLQLCLDVSQHFQLVLLGNGPAREQIRWLIKRYHLETQVWLLGEKSQNDRSLESFAALVIAARRPDWDDLSLALTAREKKITVMGREGTILKELLESDYGQVVEMDDQQALAQAWLGLYHNPVVEPGYQKRTKDLVSFEVLADKLLAII